MVMQVENHCNHGDLIEALPFTNMKKPKSALTHDHNNAIGEAFGISWKKVPSQTPICLKKSSATQKRV